MPATDPPAPPPAPRAGGRPHRPPPRPVEVVSTSRLTARLVSLILGGDALAGFPEPAPTAHIKLFLPEPDGTMRTAVAGPDGAVVWPDGRPTMRTYTPRRFDPDARTLEVWAVLHGAGPAATWAAHAKPGDRVAIGGPGGRFSVDRLATRWWVGGDESALPALATLIEALPAHVEAAVHVEAGDAADVIDLPEHPGVEVVWHLRADASRDTEPGDLLVEALLTDILTPQTHVWAGCEAAAVRRIRAAALGSHGLPRTQVTTRGYWRIGQPDHPDHDFGED